MGSKRNPIQTSKLCRPSAEITCGHPSKDAQPSTVRLNASYQFWFFYFFAFSSNVRSLYRGRTAGRARPVCSLLGQPQLPLKNDCAYSMQIECYRRCNKAVIMVMSQQAEKLRTLKALFENSNKQSFMKQQTKL